MFLSDDDRDIDRYFMKLQKSVAEEENKLMTQEDEERLFSRVGSYLKKPFAPLGIFTLQKLAFIPHTVCVDRLKDIGVIICKNIFNPLTDASLTEYVDFCKAFAYLKASASGWVTVTFEQILISCFIDELGKTISYSQRLKRLLLNRDIAHEKKQKWLEKQIELQRHTFEITIHQSIDFLNKLFQLYPEIVYRVTEFLLKSGEENGFHYLCTLLEKVSYSQNFENVLQAKYTNINKLKMDFFEKNENNIFFRQLRPPLPLEIKTMTTLFDSIIALSNQNYMVTTFMRDNIQQQLIEGNDMKENYPQDYIKYCIKDGLLSTDHGTRPRLKPLNDFEIDDEDEYKCGTFTLRSRDYNALGKWLFWNGLRVKILEKKCQ